MSRTRKDSSDQSQKIPSSERLKAIVEATKRFIGTVQRNFFIAGQVDPPGYSTSLRIVQLIKAITDLERELNPRKIPFGGNGRKAFGSSNWPAGFELVNQLVWLRNLTDGIIRSWQLEPICEGKRFTHTDASDWPPKIEKAVLESMLTAAISIEEIAGQSEGTQRSDKAEKPKAPKRNTQKRGRGILNQQVRDLLKSSPSNITAGEVARTLNKNYAGVHTPTSASAVGKTESWKQKHNKNHRKK